MRKWFCQFGMASCLLGVVVMICALIEGTMPLLPALGCASALAVAQYGFFLLDRLCDRRVRLRLRRRHRAQTAASAAVVGCPEKRSLHVA